MLQKDNVSSSDYFLSCQMRQENLLRKDFQHKNHTKIISFSKRMPIPRMAFVCLRPAHMAPVLYQGQPMLRQNMLQIVMRRSCCHCAGGKRIFFLLLSLLLSPLLRKYIRGRPLQRVGMHFPLSGISRSTSYIQGYGK